MFGSARANTAGIAYTRFAQGLGELTPVQQWFKPIHGVAEPLGANGVEEGDSEFPVDDTIEADCLGGRLTLTLPGTWLGHFLAVEGEQSVSFYNKENHEADESTGLLFTVVLSDCQSEKELEAAGYPDYRNLGRWEGGLVIALLPSDVQFSETNSALEDAYLSMNNDINIVLITLTING